MVYAWAIDRVEDPVAFRDELFRPPRPVSPDRVPQQVVDDEMAAFRAFRAQVGGVG